MQEQEKSKCSQASVYQSISLNELPAHEPLPLRRQRRLRTAQIVRVRPHLTRVPDRHAAKALERLAVRDDALQLCAVDIAAARRARRAGNSQEDLDILVAARVAAPVVPGLEVEVGLVCRAAHVRLRAAVVVVELHEDGVEVDLSLEHVVHVGVRVWALRRSSEHPVLARLGLVRVHEAAQLVGEVDHVLG